MTALKTKNTPSSSLTQDNLRQIIDLQAAMSSAAFDLDSFMSIVVERVQEFTYATGAVVELVEGDEMVYRAASGSVAPYVGLRLKMATSLSGLCVHNGEIMISDDTSKDPRVDGEACRKIHAASMLVVPLSRKDMVLGVLKVISDRIHAFDEHHIYTLQLLAGVLGGALGQQIEIHEQQREQVELRHMAQYDALTGLPNRALFNDRLSHAIARHKRSNTHLALMYMDIDRFKTINDTYGHAAGDALLKEFSSRVSKVLRTSDTFARLGGDEFVLVAENLKSSYEAEQIAAKIMEALRGKIHLQGQMIAVTVSLGIAVISGREIDAQELMQRADAALYKVKKAGRNGFVLADPPVA